MNEILAQQWIHIASHTLPDGHCVFFDDSENTYTDLWLFTDRDKHIKLCISHATRLADRDATTYEEIVDIYENPELLSIYDWQNEKLIEKEALNVVQGYLVDCTYLEAGSVSEFGDQSPTTTVTTH